MKKLALVLSLLLAASTPVFAKKGEAQKAGHGHKAHIGKILHKLDKDKDHKIDGSEVDALKKIFAKADSPLKKLDKNGNGQLDDSELAKINKRLAKKGHHGKKGDKGDAATGKKGKKAKGDKGEGKGKKHGKKAK